MIKSTIKVTLKVLLALGAVFAAVAAILYFTEEKNDYIEIYNDEYDGDLYE